MQEFCIGGPLQERAFSLRTALECGSRSWTYSQLAQDIEQQASGLRALGIRRGDTVGIDIAEESATLRMALALHWLGCRWFRATQETVYSTDLFYNHIVSDKQRSATPQGQVHLLDGGEAPGDSLSKTPAHRFADGDIVLFGQSSGSTGKPKILPVTAGKLRERSRPDLFLDESDVPRVASCLHPLHVVSFYLFLRTLRRGGTVVVSAGNVISKGMNATHVFFSPAMAGKFLNVHAASAGEKLHSCLIGGGPLYPPVARELLRHISKVFYTYGAQEGGLVACKMITQESDAADYQDVGPVIDGVELKVVDDNGNTVPAGETGEICYRTPSLIDGYIGAAEGTDGEFSGGYFFPGDLGIRNSDGRLFITGRVRERLNIGGVVLNASWIEEVVCAVAGVSDACSATLLGSDGVERLVIGYQLATAGQGDVTEAIRAQLKDTFGAVGAKAALFTLPDVPRNENGKLDRAALAVLARQHLETL